MWSPFAHYLTTSKENFSLEKKVFLRKLARVILAQYFLICQGLKDVTVENKEGGSGKGSMIPKLQFSQREKKRG